MNQMNPMKKDYITIKSNGTTYKERVDIESYIKDIVGKNNNQFSFKDIMGCNIAEKKYRELDIKYV